MSRRIVVLDDHVQEEIETIGEVIVDIIDAMSVSDEDREQQMFRVLTKLRGAQMSLDNTVNQAGDAEPVSAEAAE